MEGALEIAHPPSSHRALEFVAQGHKFGEAKNAHMSSILSWRELVATYQKLGIDAIQLVRQR